MAGLFFMTLYNSLKENIEPFVLFGASFTIHMTIAEAMTAKTELQAIINSHRNDDKKSFTICGKEEPIVKAAIKIPIAIPRCFGNHWDNIFTATG